mgnify:FL=1
MSQHKQFAVIQSAGRYSSGEMVTPVFATDDKARAVRAAAKATVEYQATMAKRGGSSGGYIAVEWGYAPRAQIMGHDAARLTRVS